MTDRDKIRAVLDIFGTDYHEGKCAIRIGPRSIYFTKKGEVEHVNVSADKDLLLTEFVELQEERHKASREPVVDGSLEHF